MQGSGIRLGTLPAGDKPGEWKINRFCSCVCVYFYIFGWSRASFIARPAGLFALCISANAVERVRIIDTPPILVN